MNLKLLFTCVCLVALLLPVELKKHRKHKRKHLLEKKYEKYEDIIKDVYFQIIDRITGDDGDEEDDEEDGNSDWVSQLQEPEGRCNPNPCLNGGVCEQRGSNFICDCPKHFKGQKCQRGPKHCKPGLCGRGECVLTSTPPFFGCKCKEPFQPPLCLHVAVCENNPCRNGGVCVRDVNDFECQCPAGYRGRFCHVGPGDCFPDDGESYRGTVSETEDGHECLHWNSHFILDSGINPFRDYEDENGLGHHNFCRNPDGDTMPWCFYRKGLRLKWDYCDVPECLQPTVSREVGPSRPHLDDESSEDPIDQPAAPQPKPTAAQPAAPVPTAGAKPGPPLTSASTEFSTCGKPKPMRQITRVWGGLKALPGAQPWQVSLQVRNRGTSFPFHHICGGVLIDSCWVLTAGHCIEQQKEMQVVLGSLSMDLEEPDEQILEVEQVIRHENYQERPNAVHNDIALLKLKGADGRCANESQFVKAACLPDALEPDGKECTISGWGITEQSLYGSNNLLDAKVLLINKQKCSEDVVYGTALDDGMLCAGFLQGGVDSCQGDSGGPLTCDKGLAGGHVIYGLVSWGDSCGKKNKPGVYTRVIHFLDWIKAKRQAMSTASTSQ